MDDKYANGFVSGLIGGLAGAAVNLLMIFLFKFGSIKFVDFAGELIFGHFPENFGEDVIAFLAYFGFAGTLGVIFAYLIPIFSFKYFLLKGIHFGIGVWFASYAITFLFKAPNLQDISLESAITNYLASFVYGLVMAVALRRWIKKEEKPGA